MTDIGCVRVVVSPRAKRELFSSIDINSVPEEFVEIVRVVDQDPADKPSAVMLTMEQAETVKKKIQHMLSSRWWRFFTNRIQKQELRIILEQLP